MKRVLAALLPLLPPSSAPASPHDDADQLGKLSFPTSCDTKVQPQFERGVAMLHSYWFGEARKTFEAVSQAGSQLRDGLLGHCRRPFR